MLWIVSLLITIILVLVVCCFIYVRWPYLRQKPTASRTCDILQYPFKTGDLLLTSVKAPLFHSSTFTKLLSASPFNHVGIIYVDPRDGHVYVWEMVTSGPRLLSLHLINSDPHCSRVYVRPINKSLDPYKFEAIMHHQYDKIFNTEVVLTSMQRVLPYLPLLRGYHWGDDQQRHCSLLAYEAYVLMGVMAEEFDRYAILPCDFARCGDGHGATMDCSDFCWDNRENKHDRHHVHVNGGIVLRPIRGYEFGELIHLDASAIPKWERSIKLR